MTGLIINRLWVGTGPLLRYSVTNEVTFLSNDVTDRYFLLNGNAPSN